jgi:hypothetical protein
MVMAASAAGAAVYLAATAALGLEEPRVMVGRLTSRIRSQP